MASAREWRRSSGQRYRATTMPHAMKLNAMLIPNKASGGIINMWASSMSAIDPCLTSAILLSPMKADSSTSSSAYRAEFPSRITVSPIAGSCDSRVPDVGNSAMALKRTGLAAKLSERGEVQYKK
jgi:hypothetical protein